MEIKVTKSALKGRTLTQFDFDMAVKGWAFQSPQANAKMLAYYESLATRLDPSDTRHETLKAIREAAK